MAASPVPSNAPRLSPVAALADCAKAVDFYRRVFGATERLRLDAPDGTIAHVELAFGDAVLMLGEAMPAMGWPATTLRLSLFVPDCDATFRQAVEAGAQVKSPPEDQFYGDRSARVVDPWGIEWSLMTHVRDVSVDEMQAALRKLYGA